MTPIWFAFAVDLDAFRTVLAPELAKEHRTQTASHARTFVTMKVLQRVNEFLKETTYRVRCPRFDGDPCTL
jgi:hypothetical protein